MAALCFSSELRSGDRNSAVDELLIGLEKGCKLARGYREARGVGEDILNDGMDPRGPVALYLLRVEASRVTFVSSWVSSPRGFVFKRKVVRHEWRSEVKIREKHYQFTGRPDEVGSSQGTGRSRLDSAGRSLAAFFFQRAVYFHA